MKETECFGILQRVFPMGAEGLREVPPGCIDCSSRMACIKTALLTHEGVQMRVEMVDRVVSKGMMGRLEQWSKKKELSRLLRGERKKSK
jgi:hypothetical protein